LEVPLAGISSWGEKFRLRRQKNPMSSVEVILEKKAKKWPFLVKKSEVTVFIERVPHRLNKEGF
jgi:hypothetical protein